MDWLMHASASVPAAFVAAGLPWVYGACAMAAIVLCVVRHLVPPDAQLEVLAAPLATSAEAVPAVDAAPAYDVLPSRMSVRLPSICVRDFGVLKIASIPLVSPCARSLHMHYCALGMLGRWWLWSAHTAPLSAPTPLPQASLLQACSIAPAPDAVKHIYPATPQPDLPPGRDAREEATELRRQLEQLRSVPSATLATLQAQFDDLSVRRRDLDLQRSERKHMLKQLEHEQFRATETHRAAAERHAASLQARMALDAELARQHRLESELRSQGNALERRRDASREEREQRSRELDESAQQRALQIAAAQEKVVDLQKRLVGRRQLLEHAHAEAQAAMTDWRGRATTHRRHASVAPRAPPSMGVPYAHAAPLDTPQWRSGEDEPDFDHLLPSNLLSSADDDMNILYE